MIMQTEIPERATSKCAVCANKDLYEFVVREMQIGLREVFEYGRCHRCGAITRLSKIHDMSRYYPSNYYSFIQRPRQINQSRFKTSLRNRRDRTLLTGGKDPLGHFLARLAGDVTGVYRLIGLSRVTLGSPVLEVGCGFGNLLRRMTEVGFQKLTGVDLFIPETAIGTSEALKIVRADLAELRNGCYDLIMMHHFLEHTDDAFTQLKLARDLLSPKGLILVRQPLCDSEAFHRYGSNWFQLDAPRHALIHSVDSMKLLLQECSLRIRRIVWDSTDQQFWASEQYATDIPMYSEESYFHNPERSRFSFQRIARWKREAIRLNRSCLGDQAAFYIERE